MLGRSKDHYWGVTLNAPDPRALADFYAAVLDWKVTEDGGDYFTVGPPDGSVAYLACQSEPLYQRPTWPAVEGEQQMMLHLEIEVGDLEVAIAEAVALGATVAEFQPQEHVRVMLDPAGHPFCLYVDLED
jgi:catechol 2,3-dioxygenase-like lactoylglutathione lyase family enzyme